MVLLSSTADLSAIDSLTLYHACDPDLSDAPILVFYGSASSSGSTTLASSRVQSHILTPAGLQSLPRLVISPSSPLYSAVNCLPRQEQGDEVCRALAYSIFKYFTDLSDIAKDLWVKHSLSTEKPSTALHLFGDGHAASLASRMRQAPNSKDVAKRVQTMFGAESISTVDVDLIIPVTVKDRSSGQEDIDDASSRYGDYSQLIQLFGDPVFIPTSKIRRAPSRPLPASRSQLFTKHQKELLRREFCELVDTEESYVVKLDNLVNKVALDFRERSKKPSRSSSSPTPQALAALFPSSLDEILLANHGFFQALRQVIEETEAAAIDDIERAEATELFSSDVQDPTGASDVALCLLQWLPKFRTCYAHYIQAHSDFAFVLKNLTGDKNSSFAARVQETGEQKLLSALIEPVQRLPRYSLYLENIIRQLPAKHPALPSFLRAKDIVADICSQDSPSGQMARTAANLQRLVKAWPVSFQPTSRLIAAVDLDESSSTNAQASLIGLLFATHLVLVAKLSSESLSARGLLAEVESQPQTQFDTILNSEPQLCFKEALPITAVDVHEIANGTAIKLSPSLRLSSSQNTRYSMASDIRQFSVGGAYEERASRFTKEFLKARTEGRFSEQTRESPRWEVLELDADQAGVGLVTAVFDKALLLPGGSNAHFPPAQVQVVLETAEAAGAVLPTPDTIQATIVSEGNGFYRLEMGSDITQKTRDVVTCGEFLPVFIKRLSNVLQMQNSLRNPLLGAYLLQHHEAILKALQLPQAGRGRSPSKSKSARQHSPVKALTNLFGGSSREHTGHKKAPSTTQLFENAPLMRPQLGPKSPSESQLPLKKTPEATVRVTPATDGPQDGASTIDDLEKALTNYLLALQARKGNVVGRVISNRASADQEAVENLYRSVLQQPLDHEPAANSSVDVLFAAFERFLKTAWEETLGPVLSVAVLDDLQYNSATLGPVEYEDYLYAKLSDLAPQNRRAFRGMLETFMDLLEAMSNDGDRGALMATMTEMIVSEGRPHDYMCIFDRFLEEHDIILNNGPRSGSTTPYQGSITSSGAARSAYTGSLSSKASSLSRRFGFTSSNAENLKTGDSRIGSVFRTMSKSSKPGDGSLRGRNNLEHARSTDFSISSSPRSRPASRDGASSVQASDEPSSRPGTGRSWDQVEQMESLQESDDLEPKTLKKKKKRRSSLSDLETLPLPNTSPFWDVGSPSQRRPEQSPLASKALLPAGDATPQLTPTSQARAHLSMPLRRAGTVIAGQANGQRLQRVNPLGSPTRALGSVERSPERKENMPPTTPDRPQPRALPPSPASRGILSERPGSGNTPPAALSVAGIDHSPTKHPSIVRKRAPGQLSPQKLRERVQTQQAAIANAESGLQAELAKIAEELAALNVSTSPTKANALVAANVSVPADMTEGIPTPRKTSATLQNISGRLKGLESKLPHLIGNLARHTEALQKDIDGASGSSADRLRDLEAQLRQSREENDALHKRHDAELFRIVEQCRGGAGESAMERKMREAMEEAARHRAECTALRLENTALKAQLDRR